MLSGQQRYYVLFRGLLNDYDDIEDVDFGELDSEIHNLHEEIDRVEPFRDPRIELDYLGNEGDLDILFSFKITWMDRDADISFYIDDVQKVIEGSTNILITETEHLGIRQS